MPHLDTYDVISVVGIPIYVVFLACAIFLSIKHGFTKSSGWRYLIVLALARIIGFSFRLAIMNDPTNTSLWIGWMTVNSLGLGPLILVLLGLLSRVFESIKRQGHILLTPTHQRLIQLLVVVAIIVTVVGGTQSSFHIENGSVKVDYATASEVGVGLMIAVMVLLCIEAFIAFRNQGYVAQGEHRILLGVIASLPFVVVRVVYSCLSVFAGINSNVWLYLCMGVLMEMIVVFMLEVLGFTLDKVPEQPKSDDPEALAQRGGQQQYYRQ
ncbi:transmembrane protein [Pochonia chlamydosporia 170]|uniref:Transmembrane protein n=1 Tax=Pochonia chlamydosporia 170 TaxID=1380566 RepID=A0A179FS36_METCM|nr:transmembrane protein [Pochonia chlamydosporia 170]OAQ68068.2 transmembrane protein [Pochonia chlamydosporia 170]